LAIADFRLAIGDFRLRFLIDDTSPDTMPAAWQDYRD